MAVMQAAMIELTGDRVDPADVVAVARHGAPARLSDEARAAMAEGAAVVERLARSDRPVYGVSTGFGSLAGTWIPPERREELQRALMRSHAAGMGPPVERDAVRAMMFLRARSLAMGRSGARPIVADTMLALLAAGLDPVVPEYGSLGASGDLAPLAHCGLALMGEGEVWTATGERVPAAEGLAAVSIEPLTLTAKEGLALINGTDGILGMLLLALHDVGRLLKVADVTAAMSTEALLGTDRAFAADLVAMRPHPGQARSAANLTRLLAGSEIVASHRYEDPRVQDAYSLRCAPQVNGATRDTWAHVEMVAAAELRSAIDNPVVLPDGRVESCGNFHGAPVALACDFLAIAAAEVGAIAERRTDRMLDPSRSYGLPPFLTEDAGRELRTTCSPITPRPRWWPRTAACACPRAPTRCPTSAMQEDHVSMGWGAARKLGTVVANLGRILAVELTCAARALDLRAPLNRRRGPRPRGPPCGRPFPAPGRTAGWRPELGGGRGADRLGRRPRGGRGRDREPRVSARTVHAPRGAERSCRGWLQEAALRMLMNNLDPDVAERPDELVVYGGTGRAARSWEAFDALVRTLRTLADDETMLVQSGKPVGVFRTHEWAPRVLIANSNLVGEWANWDEFRRLEALGLTMYGQMTAGSWIYIGSQGIVQGTYECFAEIARRRFGGSLAGTSRSPPA